jgi:hypothetical protein
MSTESIDIFENRFSDFMENKNGKELLKNMFIGKARDMRGK